MLKQGKIAARFTITGMHHKVRQQGKKVEARENRIIQFVAALDIKGAFGSEGMIQGMGISLTRWLGIANFSVWLRGFDVVGDSQFFVWLEG
jgi:hypothetical protein